MARPQGFTDAQIIAGLTKAKGLVFDAAKSIGCSAQTVYDRMKASPEIRRCVEEQRGLLLDLGERKLVGKVQRGDLKAIMYLLSTLGKDRGYVLRKELSGPNNSPIQVVRIVRAVPAVPATDA